MSPGSHFIPDLNDVASLALSDGPTVCQVAGCRRKPDRIELELEHVEAVQVAHR